MKREVKKMVLSFSPGVVEAPTLHLLHLLLIPDAAMGASPNERDTQGETPAQSVKFYT